jgi:hypothetical protein
LQQGELAMNESTVSSPFMEKLRLRLPGAIVLKHHDASTIALPDCSVTWRKRTVWFEFKLWVPTAEWLRGASSVPFEKIVSSHPTQLELCRRIAEQGHCFYVIWVKKSKHITIWHPAGYFINSVAYSSTPEVVEAAARIIEEL